MIEVQAVWKSFGRVDAVRDVTFTVPRGAVVGVLGPNGAGKTTTIRMITGTLPPSRGAVAVDGLDAVGESRKVRGKLGYLPESNPLYPEMRVAEYLAYRARLFGLGRRARAGAVAKAVERCWLGGMERRRVGALSKGYRQRVGLAAALLHEPEILILDEPTSGLDPVQIRETRDLIRGLAGERTALIVSHALAEVEKTCDRLLIIAGGRLRADGTAEDLVRSRGPGNVWEVSVALREGGSDRIAGVLRSVPGARAVDRLGVDQDGGAGVTDNAGFADFAVRLDAGVGDGGQRLGAAVASAGLPVRRLERRRVSLEQLYIGLVGEEAESPERGGEPGGAAA